MDASATEKVCLIRREIAHRIGDSRFRTWFGDSTEFTLDGDCLGVAVANPFIGSWIVSNYLNQMVEATRGVLGSDGRVDVHVSRKPGQAHGDAESVPASSSPAPARGFPPPGRQPSLRGELETLVVGMPNQLAYSAARDLVRHPGDGVRLLVLHGGCGLGKTHFLQGICNGIRRAHPTLPWRYISGEEFTNQFIYAVKVGRVDLFRARFRKVDVLVIDDIHFLANKRATQEEFLHTFNAIDASGKAIVLSSDRHPRSLATLSEPLINRLVAGMVVQIDPPDFQMRCEILRRRAAALGAEPPGDVLDFVARRVTRNVRALEGALHKLIALAALNRQPLSLALALAAVEDYADAAARTPDVCHIERIVGNYFGVSREAIRSGARDRATSLARAFAVYLLRKHTSLSYPEIARAIGHRNHSTMLMAVQRVERTLQRNGTVAWSAPAGPREVPVQDVLQALEHDLSGGPHASA